MKDREEKQEKREEREEQRVYLNKINGFNIIITVDIQDKNNTTISVEVADRGIKESETYQNVNQIQDIDFLIDRMTIGVIKQLHEKRE